MLLNAVFFKASWKLKFNPESTKNLDFTTISGAVKKVPLMYRQDFFSVKSISEIDARILELPYNGGHYSRFIILPNTKNGLTDLESKLSGQIMESTLSSMPRSTLFNVYLPKFALHVHKELKETLKALGLNSMFDDGRANFSRMVSEQGLAVTKVLQEAMIEVTEYGTMAAAVTAIFADNGLPSKNPDVIFKTDHSFLFVLRDKINGGQPLHGSCNRPLTCGAVRIAPCDVRCFSLLAAEHFVLNNRAFYGGPRERLKSLRKTFYGGC